MLAQHSIWFRKDDSPTWYAVRVEWSKGLAIREARLAIKQAGANYDSIMVIDDADNSVVWQRRLAK